MVQISSNYVQISPVSDLRVDFRTRVVIHGGVKSEIETAKNIEGSRLLRYLSISRA